MKLTAAEFAISLALMGGLVEAAPRFARQRFQPPSAVAVPETREVFQSTLPLSRLLVLPFVSTLQYGTRPNANNFSSHDQ